jgi:hypothetical protein
VSRWEVQRGDEVAPKRALARSRTQINGHQFASKQTRGVRWFRAAVDPCPHGKRLMRHVL